MAQSLIGLSKSELDTPALLVDLDVMEANIERIMALCRANKVAWRPHAKGHKTPEIAKKTIAAGAIGITCAKLSEAEIMAAAGIRNILIANQIVGKLKIERLMNLLDQADITVAVDGVANVLELVAAAQHFGKVLSVAIEVEIGLNRAGVQPGTAVVALADRIAQQPGLRFVGVVGWEGHVATMADPAEKQKAVIDAVGKLTASADACRAGGHTVEIVSCGGTGSLPYCAQQPGVTEIEAGGAILGDMHYRTNYHIDYPCALTILTTVTSRSTPTRIVLDAGKKAMSSDAAAPHPVDIADVASVRLSAEHAKIELAKASEKPLVGDKVELFVGYSDTSVHLHEDIIGIRKGLVESVWRIAARGKLK